MKTLTPFMLSLFFFLLCGAVAQESPSLGGGLSGAVSLQSPTSSGSADQVKEVVATGIGVDAASAEKQALTAAVQQAVGSYLDTKTITDNEEVIKDRVLSLSNGFVSKYDVISGPKQRDDKLFEVTVKAQVQGGQVVAKLKEVNLIKGEVAGQNLYAQNMTQMLGAEDACKMLNEKLPELFVNCIKMEFVDKDGNPRTDSNPVDQVRDDQAQKVKCTWYIKLSVDKKIYTEQMFPLVKKCLDIMLAVNPKRLEGARDNFLISKENEYNKLHYFYYKTNLNYSPNNVVLIESLSRSFDSIEGLYYSGSKYKLERSKSNNYEENREFAICSFTLKTASGELISKTSIGIGDPNYQHEHDWATLKPLAQMHYNTAKFSPFISSSDGVGGRISGSASAVEPISVEIPMNDFKEISKVDVQILPPTYNFILKLNPAHR